MGAGAAKTLANFETPQLVLSAQKLSHNIARMKARLDGFGVPLRPHIKTAKSVEAYGPALDGAIGVTVSTLAEAEYAFEHGATDILYAVAMAPSKIGRALALKAKGAELTLTVDSLAAAQAIAARAENGIGVALEIDSDGHRAGVKPLSDEAREIALFLNGAPGVFFRGLMTHAGASYECPDIEAIRAMAERERRAVVDTAAMLAEAGAPCAMVSVGSTPTATFVESFEGVTEVRAGVYMFMDLVMAGLGVCALDDIAISVLTSVIGSQKERGLLIVDAGWMALSRDRGAAGRGIDHGYGAVTTLDGAPVADMIVTGVNQEHGVVGWRHGGPVAVEDYPVGTLLRVLPNHACATAAQHGSYLVVDEAGAVTARWPRINGW